MSAKAVEVHTAYRKGVVGMLLAAKLLAEYQAELADERRFKAFWWTHLGWSRTQVYRLIRTHNCFGGLPDAAVGQFDLSALYLLAESWVHKTVRAKAVKSASGGEYITHAAAKRLAGPRPKANKGLADKYRRPGTIRLSGQYLRAEAKKVKIDAAKFLELCERVGVTVVFTDAAPLPEAA